MNITQPIEDICKACLAGYQCGLVRGPGNTYVNNELAAAFRIGFEAGRKDGISFQDGTPLDAPNQIAVLKANLTAVRVKRTRGAANKFITLGSTEAAGRAAIFDASRVLDAAGIPRGASPDVEAPYHIVPRIQALVVQRDAALGALAGPEGGGQ
ncbi:MAG: hypothetical protein WC326_01985 [Candidatus Delongbacteria bacterium]